MIFLGLFLVMHGVYSIYTAFKGGPLRGIMLPQDFFIRKLFGENASNSFYNLFWGIPELMLGIAALIGKFN